MKEKSVVEEDMEQQMKNRQAPIRTVMPRLLGFRILRRFCALVEVHVQFLPDVERETQVISPSA